MTWLIALLAQRLGEKAATWLVKGLAVLILITVLVGPYVIIYLKMRASDNTMVELRKDLATEVSTRKQLQNDLAIARQNAERVSANAEALGRSLTALHEKYLAAAGRVARLEKFLAGVDWKKKSMEDPAGTEKMLNDTILEIWGHAETITRKPAVH